MPLVRPRDSKRSDESKVLSFGTRRNERSAKSSSANATSPSRPSFSASNGTLDNAREDWKLGPLRPNRAVGGAAEKYGALTGEQITKPEIPVHTQRNRNEARAKRNLELTYPLVVDDEKYFHIAKDDRVVVIRGREKGKIGLVSSIIERTHEVIVAGVNMVSLRLCSLHA
jgi:hypothetical protein